MTTTGDMHRAVAHMRPQLREGCGFCIALTKDGVAHTNEGFVGYGDCIVCMGHGWLPTMDLTTIITNIDYPFTLVLSNDMLGWMADIELDGAPLERNGTPMELFDSPADAVYAALYQLLMGHTYSSTHVGGH